jgi:hypothetical protein
MRSWLMVNYNPGALCTAPPMNTTVDLCIHDEQRAPNAYDFNVTNIYGDRPKYFRLEAHDTNDQTFGEDDGLQSKFTFRLANGSLAYAAGVAFSNTIFDYSEIRMGDCTEDDIIEPETIYFTTVFCYFANGSSPNFEQVGYLLIDSNGAESNLGIIVFEPTNYVYACSASETSDFYDECTSRGFESNDLMGDSGIPIVVQTENFSPSAAASVWYRIHSLPRDGKLYRCGDLQCTSYDYREPIGVGDFVVSRNGDYPDCYYVGNPDYFNFNMYATRLMPGMRQDVLFPGYTDMNEVALRTCKESLDYGCPDWFEFVLESLGEVDRNITILRYNVFVQNVRSRSYISMPTAPVTYTPFRPHLLDGIRYQVSLLRASDDGGYYYPVTLYSPENKNYYAFYNGPRFINYVDPDGDSFEIQLEIDTGGASIGLTRPIETLYVRNPDGGECFDTGECTGKITLIGLKTDIDKVLRRIYVSYMAMQGNDTNVRIELRLSKRSRTLFPISNDLVGFARGFVGDSKAPDAQIGAKALYQFMAPDNVIVLESAWDVTPLNTKLVFPDGKLGPSPRGDDNDGKRRYSIYLAPPVGFLFQIDERYKDLRVATPPDPDKTGEIIEIGLAVLDGVLIALTIGNPLTLVARGIAALAVGFAIKNAIKATVYRWGTKLGSSLLYVGRSLRSIVLGFGSKLRITPRLLNPRYLRQAVKINKSPRYLPKIPRPNFPTSIKSFIPRFRIKPPNGKPPGGFRPNPRVGRRSLTGTIKSFRYPLKRPGSFRGLLKSIRGKFRRGGKAKKKNGKRKNKKKEKKKKDRDKERKKKKNDKYKRNKKDRFNEQKRLRRDDDDSWFPSRRYLIRDRDRFRPTRMLMSFLYWLIASIFGAISFYFSMLCTGWHNYYEYLNFVDDDEDEGEDGDDEEDETNNSDSEEIDDEDVERNTSERGSPIEHPTPGKLTPWQGYILNH